MAPDLPCEDDLAGLPEYANAVIEAIGDRTDLVVVAQSFGGFTAPLVCESGGRGPARPGGSYDPRSGRGARGLLDEHEI